MNKPLATVELSLATPPVTKRQRLQRFANVIRSDPRVPLHLFINLEYRDDGEWKYLAHSLVRHSRSQQKIASCTMLA